MSRALLLSLSAWSLVACRDFDEALARYQNDGGLAACVKSYSGGECAGKVCNEDACRVDADCCSGQCLNHACVATGYVTTLDLQCGDLTDCQAGDVCSPASSDGLLACVPKPERTCAARGTLCGNRTDCCGGCPSCNLECSSGVCKRTCSSASGSACETSEDCCAGLGCDGSGKCVPVDGGLPDGFHCRAPDECASAWCNQSLGRCVAPSGCSGLGPLATAGCCATLQAQQGACCVPTGSSGKCSRDDACCGGNCLDGFCRLPSSCRPFGASCGDDDDCCDAFCDVSSRTCQDLVFLNALKTDSCSVVRGTRQCRRPDGGVCVASGQPCSPGPCCHGACGATGSCL